MARNLKNSIRHTTLLLLILILFLGAILRFYKMDSLGTFRADQAIELSGARDILSGKLTLIGIKTSNSEVRNGAVMYYLLAPFVYFFRGDPLAGGTLQGLLSLGTIIAVYLIVKKNIGSKEALFASFLTATSSLLVIYSRQTMLAFYPLFFNALIFMICLSIIKKCRPVVTMLLGFLLGMTIQIHYSTIALILASCAIPLLFLDKKNWLNYSLFLAAGFILGFSPMIIFETRHEFFNLKMLLASLKQPHNQNFILSLSNLTTFWQDAISRLFFKNNIWLTRIYLLSVVGTIILLQKKLHATQKLALLFIFTSFVFTLLFAKSVLLPYEYISHYAIVSFVPLIILTSWLLGKLSPHFLLPAAIIFLAINFPGYQFSSNHGYSHANGWSPIGIEKAAGLIESDLTDRPYSVAMLVDAENQGYPLRYLLGAQANRPLPVEKYNQAKDLYVIAEPGLNLQNTSLWEISSFGQFDIKKIWTIQNGYLLYRLTKKNEVYPSSGKIGQVTTNSQQKSNFVTLVYPVRGRQLWTGSGLPELDSLFAYFSEKSLRATFLLQHDALADRDLVEKLRRGCRQCEFGIFLEVSEDLATNSQVSYKIADGGWARPDKVFLSGYSLLERKRLIDQVFGEFKREFGYTPVSIGGWYVDPYSLNYLHDKYGVSILVSVADQYDTDAQRYWGRPWGAPYYSQKYDLLSAASTVGDKLDMVQIQWAQRHPTEGFGNGVWYSQNSLQANDYTNNRRDSGFFSRVLGHYLHNDNALNQATIGLEVGQELTSFAAQHLQQLGVLTELIDSGKLRLVTMGEFASWYRKAYPGVSPMSKISDGVTTWVNAPCYRLGFHTDLQTGKIVPFDLRVYQVQRTTTDNFRSDYNHFLSREVESSGKFFPQLFTPVSQLPSDQFLPRSFTIGNTLYDLSSECQHKTEVISSPDLKIWLVEKIESINNLLSYFKTSIISGQRIFGISISPDKIIGVWFNRGIGAFSFPFQTLVRFQSPNIPNIIK